jgi:hypothetical protein
MSAIRQSTMPLLVAFALLAGCAGSTSNTRGEWAPGAARERTFSRVMVVGVSPNYNQRCAFEWSLADKIRSEATQVIASCDAMGPKVELTRENIERIVKERQVDAVLATSLLATGYGVKEGGERDTRGSGAYKAVGSGWDYGGYYGAYGVPVIYGEFVTAPPVTSLEGEVTIVTRLFDTRDAQPVYLVESRASGLQNRQEALLAITPPIAQKLRAEGLIR